MELIINTKEFNVFSSEVPKEVVGYNFYSIKGDFYGRYNVGESGYPRANYKIIVSINNKEVELNRGENLYKTNDGNYFIGKEVK